MLTGAGSRERFDAELNASNMLEHRRSSLPDIQQHSGLTMPVDFQVQVGPGLDQRVSQPNVHTINMAEQSQLLQYHSQFLNRAGGSFNYPHHQRILNWPAGKNKLRITDGNMDQRSLLQFLQPQPLAGGDRKVLRTKIKLFNASSPKNKLVLPLSGNVSTLAEGHSTPGLTVNEDKESPVK